IIGKQALLDGAPIVGDARAMLNLIHVDDAAELLMAMVSSAGAGRIELGCDNHPVERLEYYTELAHRLGVSPPSVVSDERELAMLGLSVGRLARVSSKRCDNGVTGHRTGWSPRYGDFRAGLDALLTPLA